MPYEDGGKLVEISIVMPCYNHGDYIMESLESVWSQTFSDFEVIVVDDGSDQNTKNILKRLSSDKVKVYHIQNSGPAYARNYGARKACGRFVVFLDADDLISNEYLAQCRQILLDDEKVGVVYSRAEYFGVKKGPWNLPDFSISEMLKNNIIFISAMIRRDLFEKVGGFDENLKIGYEDYDFWLSILETGVGVVRIDKPMFFYRRHKKRKGASRHNRIEHIEQYEILRRIQSKHHALYQQHMCVLFDQIKELRMQLYAANEKRKLLKRFWSKFSVFASRIRIKNNT